MFEDILKEVVILEGVYDNDFNDTGGETVFGISRNNFPAWEGWTTVDKYKTKFGTGKEFLNTLRNDGVLAKLIATFYKEHFWDPFNLDDIDDYSLAFEIFDQAVNLGKAQTATHIQRVFNALNYHFKFGCDLIVDGKTGPLTRSKLQDMAADPKYTDVFRKGLDGLQTAYYITLGNNSHGKSDYREYTRGWLLNRIGKHIAK